MVLLDTNVVSEMMRGADAAEVMTGIALLPLGARRARLVEVATAAFASFTGVLPFGEESTDAYAAIAVTYAATAATRNVKDFDGLGLELVDPWES
jgi:toxin FitB